MTAINADGETTNLPVEWLPTSCRLVRTGVISDGSCMFHAILSSYSNKYLRMSSDERSDYIKRLRSSLPEFITRDLWMRMGQGEVSRLGFGSALVLILNRVYDHIFHVHGDNSDDDDTQMEIGHCREIFDYIDANMAVCRFIASRMSLDDVLTHVVGQHKRGRNVYFESANISALAKKHFKRTYGKNLNEHDSVMFAQVTSRLVELMDLVAETAITVAYERCKLQLSDSSHWMGIEYIELISNLFSVNIYFIDADTGMPYVFADERMFPHKKSIILLWVNQSHFEIVGVIEDNSIRRTFNSDEPIIRTVHAYSTKPLDPINK